MVAKLSATARAIVRVLWVELRPTLQDRTPAEGFQLIVTEQLRACLAECEVAFWKHFTHGELRAFASATWQATKSVACLRSGQIGEERRAFRQEHERRAKGIRSVRGLSWRPAPARVELEQERSGS